MPAPFVENAFLFPLYICSFFIRIQVSIGMWIYVWVFNSIPLINVSIFMPMSCAFHYYSCEVQCEFTDTSGYSFIVQDCISYSVEFFFFGIPYEVQYCLLKVCKEWC